MSSSHVPALLSLLLTAAAPSLAHATIDQLSCPTSSLSQMRGLARGLAQRSTVTDYLGPLLENANGQNDRWKGVGAMNGNMTCTVNLVEPPGGCEPRDDQPAVIVTNGHCVGLMTLGPNVQIDKPYSAKVSFNHFKDTQNAAVQVETERILYANMHTKDLAVVQLKATYGELKRAGVKPYKIAKRYEPGRVQNIAVPTDGLSPDERFVRGSECASGDKVDLMEGSYVWRDQIAYSCPAVKGSSGSSLFNADTGEIMGLLNTGIRETEEGALCRPDGPCELGPGGPHSEHDMRYGYDVTFLHKCASPTCEIDVRREGCPLPGAPQATPNIPSHTNELEKSFFLDNPGSERFDRFQVKMGPAGQTNCADPAGYTETTGRTYAPPRANREDGPYIFCVRGHEPGKGWQDRRDIRALGTRLDRVPPVSKVEPTANGKMLLVKSGSVADPVSGFVYKFARNAQECARDSGYQKPSIQTGGRGVSLVNPQGAYVCVLGFDGAGNRQTIANATVYQVPR